MNDKKILLLLVIMLNISAVLQAQNAGINVPALMEGLNMDSIIEMGKNQLIPIVMLPGIQ